MARCARPDSGCGAGWVQEDEIRYPTPRDRSCAQPALSSTCPMFSPVIVVTMKDGRKHTGEYPYRWMEWNFDQLVVQLQDCLPGYPAGKAGFEALVALARDLHGLPSVAAIIGATTPG